MVLSALFRIGAIKMSVSKPVLEVVLYGVSGTIFTATLDLYQFRASAHILPCLHTPGPGWIGRPERASST